MKPHRNVVVRFIHTATDRELLDQLDELVSDAVSGDRRAVGAIAIAFGPTLLGEIRRELGPIFVQDEGDVMQDFCLAMIDGKLTFPPIRGAALPWMKRMVRSFAREHLRRRQREWGLAG
jgi:DNA-directed RNA polymerase specialized sigma24 family protein